MQMRRGWDAVRLVEAYVRANPDREMAVSSLSRRVGLSERGLRKAFYGVHGVSPKRWMMAARLDRVRRILSLPPTNGLTVTEVATRHGFFELGRFAFTYRQRYGESPSETLRESRHRSAA